MLAEEVWTNFFLEIHAQKTKENTLDPKIRRKKHEINKAEFHELFLDLKSLECGEKRTAKFIWRWNVPFKDFFFQTFMPKHAYLPNTYSYTQKFSQEKFQGNYFLFDDLRWSDKCSPVFSGFLCFNHLLESEFDFVERSTPACIIF